MRRTQMPRRTVGANATKAATCRPLRIAHAAPVAPTATGIATAATGVLRGRTASRKGMW